MRDYSKLIEQEYIKAMQCGYDEICHYKPNIQKAIDAQPNNRYIRIYDLCTSCHNSYIKEVVDLARDLLQINRKIKFDSNCITCGHMESLHEMHVPYKRKNWMVVPRESNIYTRFGIFSIDTSHVEEDSSKYTMKDWKFMNCTDCGCDEYVPSDQYMAWMLMQNHYEKKEYPNIEEWKMVERVQRYLLLIHREKPRYMLNEEQCA